MTGTASSPRRRWSKASPMPTSACSVIAMATSPTRSEPCSGSIAISTTRHARYGAKMLRRASALLGIAVHRIIARGGRGLSGQADARHLPGDEVFDLLADRLAHHAAALRIAVERGAGKALRVLH